MSDYDQMYERSINDPAAFWSHMANTMLCWNKPFNREKVLKDNDWPNGKIHWFDGKLNASGTLYSETCFRDHLYPETTSYKDHLVGSQSN